MNDYVRLTKDYIKEMDLYEVHEKIIVARKKDLEESIKDVSTKIVKYEQNPGGSSELTTVEAETAKRLEWEKKLKQCDNELKTLRQHINRVKKCMEGLTQEEQEMLRLHYCVGATYEEMSDLMGWSPRTCKRRIHDIRDKVSLMLFGDKMKASYRFIEVDS